MRAPSIYALIVAALVALAAPAPSSAAESPCPPVLDHKFSNLRDEPVSLCQFRGKVLLIVNTASECGYTPQYEGLEKLYRRYRDKGFAVLGFPANDFGGRKRRRARGSAAYFADRKTACCALIRVGLSPRSDGTVGEKGSSEKKDRESL